MRLVGNKVAESNLAIPGCKKQENSLLKILALLFLKQWVIQRMSLTLYLTQDNRYKRHKGLI